MANEDRTVYTLTLEDILCMDYDYKILVVKDKSLAVTTDVAFVPYSNVAHKSDFLFQSIPHLSAGKPLLLL